MPPAAPLASGAMSDASPSAPATPMATDPPDDAPRLAALAHVLASGRGPIARSRRVERPRGSPRPRAGGECGFADFLAQEVDVPIQSWAWSHRCAGGCGARHAPHRPCGAACGPRDGAAGGATPEPGDPDARPTFALPEVRGGGGPADTPLLPCAVPGCGRPTGGLADSACSRSETSTTQVAEDSEDVSGDGCYPFPFRRPIQHGRGRDINVVQHLTSLPARRAIVIFLPGIFGGVGPCRADRRKIDEAALFPSLAEALSRAYPVDCHRVSWASCNPNFEDIVYAVCRVALYVLTVARSRAPTRVVLVGHSFGGGVAFSAALKLTEMLKGTSATIAGVVGLSPQAFGASDAVASLVGVPKLFIHSVDDDVLEVGWTLWLHCMAQKPKELKLFGTGGHNYEGQKDSLHAKLRQWVVSKAGLARGNSPPGPSSSPR